MPEINVAIEVPGPEDAALALWDDPRRWPTFVDGFGSVSRVDEGWPAPGTAIVWMSGPHGAGRTREQSVEPGVRSVETEQLTGTLSAGYLDGHFQVSLNYQLKERTPYALFFVRRSLRDSLRRTAVRYAIERRADAELVS